MRLCSNRSVQIVLAIILGTACGCSRKPSRGLTELGFYIVTSGKARHVLFREYDSGSTHRPLPAADFLNVPVLGAGDYLLLYGDVPSGPMGSTFEVFRYKRSGDTYESAGREAEASFESFFTLEPQEPLRGQKVTKLSPKPTVSAGTFFLHKYVGLNGDAYLCFRFKK